MYFLDNLLIFKHFQVTFWMIIALDIIKHRTKFHQDISMKFEEI